MSRNYREPTIKALFAKSGNRCAFPDCNAPIVEDEGNIVTGEICHIEAESPNGPRYNRNQTELERNNFDNLILMCSRHHKIIDSNESKYPVELLKEWKKNQESKESDEQQKLMEEKYRQMELQSEAFWQKIKEMDDADNTGLKRKVEENDIEELLIKIEDGFKALMDNLMDMADKDENAMTQLEELCKLAGVDFNQFDLTKVDYKKNPFINRNWETHCWVIPNISNQLQMEFFQCLILMLEEITKYNHSYDMILKTYRDKFKNFQVDNYYAD